MNLTEGKPIYKHRSSDLTDLNQKTGENEFIGKFRFRERVADIVDDEIYKEIEA